MTSSWRTWISPRESLPTRPSSKRLSSFGQLTVKGQDDIVEAMGEDAVEEMAVQLVGTSSVDGVRF